jgi:uroporphyrinogen-III synthase
MARQSAPGIPVLVTRPQAEGEAFAAALTARFGDRVRPVVAPLIAPRFLTPVIPAHDYSAVVFTSAQAVVGACRLGVPLPRLAWCVGRRTASVATAAGFDARSADGDVDRLAEAIISAPTKGRILYLRGVDTRGNLLEKLGSSGVHADVEIVYVQEHQPLTGEAIQLLVTPAPLIVPLFSPRTAMLFRQAVPPGAQAQLHIAAMSVGVAEALADLPCASLVIANHPDAASMVASVETLLAGLPAP